MTKYSRYLVFFVLLVMSAFVWWQALIANFRLALLSDAHTYVLLILPISITLIYLEMDQVPEGPQTGRIWGAILLALALSLRVVTGGNLSHSSSSGNLSLSVAALVIFWIGTAIVSFGLHALKTHLFAVCFLFLLIPLPDHAVIWLTSLLQRQSASASTIVFRLAGVPIVQDGVMLSIPGLNIEVAKECSSIRSSTMVVVTTLLLAQLFLKSSWRKVLLVATSLPVSVAKNALRIFVIAELGTRVDRGYLNGWLHHQGGFIYLGLALLFEIFLLLILRWNEASMATSTSKSEYALLRIDR
ncbi:MAG TPA: exosortase/archaeosortase family protein [Candidatus Eisenbacteria bacterium]|nr:exosortase/archaeosortase family protein [Candidatus Eisenbacteria bacterium]